MERRPILSIYGYIYITTNLVNSKKYIGKHTYNKPELDKRYLGSGKVLKKAVRKYGKENFCVEILDWAQSLEELNELENCYITEYNAVKSDEFYNSSEGGDGVGSGENNPMYGKKGVLSPIYGTHPTDESRAKMSESHKGKISPMFGKHQTEQSRKKISENHFDLSGKNHPMYNKHHTLEAKKKMSVRKLGITHSFEHNDKIGKSAKCWWDTFGEDQKNRMSEQNLGKNNPNARAVIQLDKDCNIVREYSYMGEVKLYGFQPTNVGECCRSAPETTYRGFMWRYKDEFIMRNNKRGTKE